MKIDDEFNKIRARMLQYLEQDITEDDINMEEYAKGVQTVSEAVQIFKEFIKNFEEIELTPLPNDLQARFPEMLDSMNTLDKILTLSKNSEVLVELLSHVIGMLMLIKSKARADFH